jgi:peptidyl-prolyl cis-trans isomerase SurA
MNTRSSLLVLLLLLLEISIHAQSPDDRILMTVGGRNVPAGEFIRMFNKSYGPDEAHDIDSYLQQFIIFKLKVADAIHAGMDTTKAFRNELNGYRNQLAQNYLTDTKTKENLLQKTYQRYLTEINASHILVSCPEGAKPADTLNAWQKASDIRERIINGEPFEQVARGTSDDPSVKFNGGNLGYFTVFQMITPFEDAAYNLKKGGLSEPVRTPYGYHIIRVNDKRPSKGRVLVAHIMKASPPGTPEEEVKKAQESINTIYKELQAGASFGELARKYSDHKESASGGGKLNWFGTGEMISEFAEAAFSITDTGKFCAPVRTIYGWHIIKLLDRKKPGTFEETRSYLESKINQSYLNSLSRKSFVEKLKKEYNFRINQTAFDWFVSNTDTLIIQGLAKYDKTNLPDGMIYTFASQGLTVKDFAASIERRASMIVTDDPLYFITQSIETRLSDQILKYENSILERKYPEFRYLMNEFHDGILLFEISGKKVWNRIQEDSAGLQRYYEENKHKYLTKRGIDVKIYTLEMPDGAKKLSSAYRKYSGKRDADELMRGKFNKKDDTLLVINENRWFSGDNEEIDKLNWEEAVQSCRINGYPSIAVVKKILEPVPLAFSEVQGEMMTGFQDYLENNWTEQLKVKYTVKLDSVVFADVKRRLGNE